MELDATKWREGRQCGAHQRHGPRQGRGRRMVRGRNGRSGYGWVQRGEGKIYPTSRGTQLGGRGASGGGTGEGRIRPASRGAQRADAAERAGDADKGGAGEVSTSG
jgi:hypothetical protein